MATNDPVAFTIHSDELNGILEELMNQGPGTFVPAKSTATNPMGADSTHCNNQTFATCQTNTTEIVAVASINQEHVRKAGRRRNSGSSAKVKELSEQLQHVQDRLATALTDNIYLHARKEIMEQLLSSRDKMIERQARMRNGTLGWNPMSVRGTTVEEYPIVCTPTWVADTTGSAKTRMAVLYSSLTPILLKYPVLVSRKAWKVDVPAAVTQPPLPPQLQLTETVPKTALTTQQLEDLAELSKLGQDSTVYAAHAFVRYPKLLWINGAHVRVLRAGYETWESFAGALGSGQTYDGEPVLAPESHWEKVIRSLQLDDWQYLQCFALWEVCTAAKMSVTAQRTTLFKELTMLRQQEQQQTHDEPLSVAYRDADHLDKEQELLRQLDVVSAKDESLFFTAVDVLLSYICSPIQFAICMGTSFPYVPDCVALIRAGALQCTQEVMTRLSEQVMPRRP